jgi:hypothetical protein
MTDTPHFDKLEEAVKCARKGLAQIESSNKYTVNNWIQSATIKITAGQDHYGNGADDRAKMIADRVRTMLVDEARKEGERRRDMEISAACKTLEKVGREMINLSILAGADLRRFSKEAL